MKKIPLRTCMGCNEKKSKKEMIRIVKNKEGYISIDKTGKKDGRGAYICNQSSCLDKVIKSKRLEKALEDLLLKIKEKELLFLNIQLLELCLNIYQLKMINSSL